MAGTVILTSCGGGGEKSAERLSSSVVISNENFDLTEHLQPTPDPDKILSADNNAAENLGDKMLSLGKRIAEIQKMPNGNEVLVLVGDNEITKKRLEIAKANNAAIMQPKTERDVLVNIIRSEVALAEAKKRGLVPTEDEVNIAVASTLKVLDENNPEFEQTKIQIEKYLEGSGISRETYIENQKANMCDSLTRNNLAKEVKKKYDSEIVAKALESGKNPDISDKEYYNQYLDALVQSTKIEIYDPDIAKLLSKN
jgi:parvulin-like peptidyl-prolyl isomerase